jgi:hypothetical protein
MTDLASHTSALVSPRGETSPQSHSLSLDDAAAVDERRRTSAVTSLYEALLRSMSTDDQRWVLDVVGRHRRAEREAEERGEVLPGPAW